MTAGSTGDNSEYDDRPDCPPPADVVRAYRHLLPQTGRALDLACGLGGNALVLAHCGLQTEAWDWNADALRQLATNAARLNLAITTRQRDVEAAPPAAEQFDVITVSHFLHRPTLAALRRAVRPGGLILYQTFRDERVNTTGPRNPDYLLKDNELLQLFAGFMVRAYRDEGRIGRPAFGWRNKAMIVAQRPAHSEASEA